MRYFIEVCSGDRSFEEKLQSKRHINAPINKRYFTMLSKIKKNDIIIHYLTIGLTKTKEWKAGFVGESVVDDEMRKDVYRYICELRDVKAFPHPVKLSSLKKRDEISQSLKRAIGMSMQSYIFEIVGNDYELIKKLSKEDQHIV